MNVKVKRTFGLLTGFVMLMLMFCPYMEAAVQPKPESTCHSETDPPETQELRCCGNDAVPVQQFQIEALCASHSNLSVIEPAGPEFNSSPSYEFPLLFRNTMDLLTSLSVLRL
jgi:hypothetical protein